MPLLSRVYQNDPAFFFFFFFRLTPWYSKDRTRNPKVLFWQFPDSGTVITDPFLPKEVEAPGGSTLTSRILYVCGFRVGSSGFRVYSKLRPVSCGFRVLGVASLLHCRL